jgi:hypothetical protein
MLANREAIETTAIYLLLTELDWHDASPAWGRKAIAYSYCSLLDSH